MLVDILLPSGWSYNTLAWKICNGPKTIKRGPLAGFYIEQETKR
jgi:hypothetical protein